MKQEQENVRLIDPNEELFEALTEAQNKLKTVSCILIFLSSEAKTYMPNVLNENHIQILELLHDMTDKVDADSLQVLDLLYQGKREEA